MKITALVEALVAAGATPEMILVAVRTTESAELQALETAREKTRARVQKWRSTKASNVTDGHVTVRNGSRASVTRVEDNLLTQKIEPQEEDKGLGASAPKTTPRAELATVLDAGHVEAVIEHRQRLRKPLTAHAARLLAGKFARCPDPNGAADSMIEGGWLKIEPEWLERQRARGSPPPKRQNLTDFLNEREAANGFDSRPTQAAVLHLPARRIG